ERRKTQNAIPRRIKRLASAVDVLACPADSALHGEYDLDTDTVKLAAADAGRRDVLEHEHPQTADVAGDAVELDAIVVEKVHRLGVRQRKRNGEQAARLARPRSRPADLADVLHAGRIAHLRN